MPLLPCTNQPPILNRALLSWAVSCPGASCACCSCPFKGGCFIGFLPFFMTRFGYHLAPWLVLTPITSHSGWMRPLPALSRQTTQTFTPMRHHDLLFAWTRAGQYASHQPHLIVSILINSILIQREIQWEMKAQFLGHTKPHPPGSTATFPSEWTLTSVCRSHQCLHWWLAPSRCLLLSNEQTACNLYSKQGQALILHASLSEHICNSVSFSFALILTFFYPSFLECLKCQAGLHYSFLCLSFLASGECHHGILG